MSQQARRGRREATPRKNSAPPVQQEAPLQLARTFLQPWVTASSLLYPTACSTDAEGTGRRTLVWVHNPESSVRTVRKTVPPDVDTDLAAKGAAAVYWGDSGVSHVVHGGGGKGRAGQPPAPASSCARILWCHSYPMSLMATGTLQEDRSSWLGQSCALGQPVSDLPGTLDT